MGCIAGTCPHANVPRHAVLVPGNFLDPDVSELDPGAVAEEADVAGRSFQSGMLGPVHGDPRWAPFIEGVRRRVAQWRREFRWPPA